MIDELKTCPFCGGEAFLQRRRMIGDEKFVETWIQCAKCYASTRNCLSDETAINAWNRRA